MVGLSREAFTCQSVSACSSSKLRSKAFCGLLHNHSLWYQVDACLCGTLCFIDRHDADGELVCEEQE